MLPENHGKKTFKSKYNYHYKVSSSVIYLATVGEYLPFFPQLCQTPTAVVHSLPLKGAPAPTAPR